MKQKLKPALIEFWRMATGPWRQFRLQRLSRAGEVPVFVLFYHRVADTEPNPWSMTNAEFEQQITWFQENFDVVSLEEVQRRIATGNSRRPCISITFDDGYAENCERALPMLIERGVPFTYFVTTHHTTNQANFAHDVNRGAPLPANTIESLKTLVNAGVEIGGHTRTHIDLGSTHSPGTIYDEVIAATREMETLLNTKIRYFAFPFGQHANLNVDVFHLLKQNGFKGVCSAYGGWNKIGGDSFHLQRIHGDPSFTRMRNWLTFDPRIEHIERFDYCVSKSTIDWLKFSPTPASSPETNKLETEKV